MKKNYKYRWVKSLPVFLTVLSMFLLVLSGCCFMGETLKAKAGNGRPVKVTGIYSDMLYHDETGDVVGVELFIFYSREGYYVLYQESEGSPNSLMLLPVTLKDNRVKFEYSYDNDKYYTFSGVIVDDGILGTYSNERSVELKRKESFWADNEKTSKVTGCFSDLYYNEEGGDLLGYEFFIVYSVNDFYVLYQESSGEPVTPLLLPVDVKGDSISFTMPSEHGSHGKFEGTVTDDGLTGRFSNIDEHIELKRKNSYWQ